MTDCKRWGYDYIIQPDNQMGLGSHGAFRISGVSRSDCAVAFAMCVCGAAFTACDGSPSVTGNSVPERILTIPGARMTAFAASPDGALFVAVGGRISRALPPRYSDWLPILEAPTIIVDLFAFSRDQLYASSARSILSYRRDQDDGWVQVMDSIPEAVLTDSGRIPRPLLFDMWGRSPSDFFVVGSYATILHFNGKQWVREQNPLVEFAQKYSPSVFRSLIIAVGGDSTTVMAGGLSILRRSDLGWAVELYDRLVDRCIVGGIASSTAGVYIGGGDSSPCLLRLSGDSLQDLSAEVRSLREPIEGGREQGDGSALLWTYGGGIVEMRGNSVSVYPEARFRSFVGAGVVDSFLYSAGTNRGGDAVVERVIRK